MKIDKNSISLFGFRGKILEVDLTNKLIKETPLDLKSIKDFIGGAGYACRFLIENIDQNTNPLSPENILIIMTGPYCLSGIPGSGRFVICSKSPYTNLLGESNCGGSFGPEMKKAGYDGIFIKGKAESPVYLNITNHDNEILDANSLWGLDIK
ncbi:MAG: aldehyde ferredoxin oxidoreductase N-terminal domain-containing protein, partial [Candidatus Lokiarchaeota archaeon]